MRVKSMLIFIVLNIFLMLFSSVAFEYVDLEKRMNNITTVVNEAGEAAVKVSTASEELFSAKYLQHETSYGVTTTHCPEHKGDYTKVATNILMFDNDGNAHQVSTYALAYYYCVYDNIPTYSTDFNKVNSYAKDMTTEDVYEFLYGESGSQFASPTLSWANRNNSVWNLAQRNNNGSVGRMMNTSGSNAFRGNLSPKGYQLNDFESYVNHVLDVVYTSNYLKKQSNDKNSNYTLQGYSYPVLLNMGLKMRRSNPEYSAYALNGGTKEPPIQWNTLLDVNSERTNDYFTSSFHWGKVRQFGAGQTSSKTGISNGMYSKYFLTPNTLGVTYIPLSVVKPSFIGLVKAKVQLNKVSGGEIGTNKDLRDVVKEALGCLETSVYDTSKGVVANVSQSHITDSDEQIVNDGDIEYDLNSVKVKVEYFDCNFYNDYGISQVVSRLEGAVPNWKNVSGSNYGKDAGLFPTQSDNVKEIVKRLRLTDTRSVAVFDKGGNDGRGKRLVAKVTFRIKVHIPYHSSVLQWMCYKDKKSSHYDIRSFNPSQNQANMESSGVWYQYTTYYSVTR